MNIVEKMTARDIAVTNLDLGEVDDNDLAAITKKIERAGVLDMMWLLRWLISQTREIKRLQYQHAN